MHIQTMQLQSKNNRRDVKLVINSQNKMTITYVGSGLKKNGFTGSGIAGTNPLP